MVITSLQVVGSCELVTIELAKLSPVSIWRQSELVRTPYPMVLFKVLAHSLVDHQLKLSNDHSDRVLLTMSISLLFVRVIGLKRGVMWFIPLVRPRTTHEGNKSHNHELKADKRLIFTLARIPQGMQKYIDEKWLYSSFFCFLTLHAGTSWDSQVSRLFNYVSFSKLHF